MSGSNRKKGARVMMIDRLLADGKIRLPSHEPKPLHIATIALRLLRSEAIQVIGADSVSDFMAGDTGNNRTLWDYPSWAPPFRATWYEWKNIGLPSNEKRFGVLAIADDVGPLLDDFAPKPEARWHVTCFYFAEPRDNINIPGLYGIAYLPIDGHGNMVRGPTVAKGFTTLYDRGNAKTLTDGETIGDGMLAFQAISLFPDRSTEAYYVDMLAWQLHILGMTCSFLSCKNVLLMESRPPAKLSKAFRRKHGRPLITVKTLDIKPMRQVLETEGGCGENGLTKALHICRGHFKTYTAERPLLGRIVGRFWWQQHLRGSHEHGVVAKDYRVRGPESDNLPGVA
jgi:hypothetical protein